MLNGFVWSIARSALSSLFLVRRFESSDSVRFNSIEFIVFQRSFDWGFQRARRFWFLCSVIIWARGRGCCWGWWMFCSSLAFRDTLLGNVCLADLGMDLRSYSSSATSSDGWVCWKGLKLWCVVTLVWSFSPAWEAIELTTLVWKAPRCQWRGGHHFH